MDLPFATLDVFTSTRFQGNPLAIVSVPRRLRTRLSPVDKQRIAREFNLSETVFLHDNADDGVDADGDDYGSNAGTAPGVRRRGGGGGGGAKTREIEIFTTDCEVPFAGHPTIGTAVWCRFHEHNEQEQDGTAGNTSRDVGSATGGGSDGLGGGRSRSPVLDTLVTKAGPIALTCAADADSYANAGEDLETHRHHHVSARIPHDVHIHAHTLADVLGLDIPFSSPLCFSPPSSSPPQGLSEDPEIRAAELGAPVVSIVNGMTFLLVKLDSLDALGRVEVTGLEFGEELLGMSRKGDEEEDEGEKREDRDKKYLIDEGWRDSFVARYYYVDDGPVSGEDREEKDNKVEEGPRHLRWK